MAIFPTIGLVWYGAFDPIVVGAAGVQQQFFIRTDVPSLYYFVGPGPTNWVLLTAGAFSGMSIRDEGVVVVASAAAMNFVGPGVVATDVAGVATITVSPTPETTITVANTPYTILAADDYLMVDTSGGAITAVLPNPALFTYAKEFFIVDTKGTFATNNLTLSPFAGEKISGLAANKVFQTAWGGWTVVTDGVDWYVR